MSTSRPFAIHRIDVLLEVVTWLFIGLSTIEVEQRGIQLTRESWVGGLIALFVVIRVLYITSNAKRIDHLDI